MHSKSEIKKHIEIQNTVYLWHKFRSPAYLSICIQDGHIHHLAKIILKFKKKHKTIWLTDSLNINIYITNIDVL